MGLKVSHTVTVLIGYFFFYTSCLDHVLRPVTVRAINSSRTNNNIYVYIRVNIYNRLDIRLALFIIFSLLHWL